MTYVPRSRSDRNINVADRWTSREWLERDLASITTAFGPLPLNHLKRQAPPQTAFTAWLEAVLHSATVEYVMSSSSAYGQCYAIYRSLAEHQRNHSHTADASPVAP